MLFFADGQIGGINMAKRTIRLRDDEILRKHCKVVKEITTNDDAFAHLEQIEINQNNAFLLSKRLTGKRQ